MRKRMLWLIPYNVGIIWGTLRYCGNIKNIAGKYWPKYQKVNITNLIFISTVQAIGFTTLYLAGTFGILGINPVNKIREIKEEARNPTLVPMPLTTEEGNEVEVNMTNSQRQLVSALNAMGVSNDSIL